MNELWDDAVVPFFKDKSFLGRATKATVASSIGSVAGHVLDGVLLVTTGRRARLGRVFGLLAGGVAGWLAPEILDVDWERPNATYEEFQIAYRRAATRWHPDLRPGDRETVVRMVHAGERRRKLGGALIPVGRVARNRLVANCRKERPKSPRNERRSRTVDGHSRS